MLREMTKTRTTPYHPSSNQTLKNVIASFADKWQLKWEDMPSNGQAQPWCICSNCRNMPTEIENPKCCRLRRSITSEQHFMD